MSPSPGGCWSKIRSQCCRAPVNAHFLVYGRSPPCYIFTWQRGAASSIVSSYEGTNPIHEGSPLWPKHPSKASSPNTFTLGIRLSTCELEGDTNTQFITLAIYWFYWTCGSWWEACPWYFKRIWSMTHIRNWGGEDLEVREGRRWAPPPAPETDHGEVAFEVLPFTRGLVEERKTELGRDPIQKINYFSLREPYIHSRREPEAFL